ncbi:MAG: DUF115 domain-containing protein [Gammaproteobacteria bacterium]|nr:DUF115 domain-containing protein [Gammaproteobacteria bacterium]
MIKIDNDSQLGTLIENQFGDKYLFSVNRKNFEEVDYQTQFYKEFNDIFDREDTLYIITGTDSGMMVKQLLKTPPEKGSAYLFIDFPEVIDLTKDQYDLLDYKRIIVTTEDKWQEDAKKIGMDIYYMLNKVKKIKSFSAQYYYLKEYIYLNQSLQETSDHLTWQYQSQLGSKTFVQKQLENLNENHSPAIHLKDYFKGKSAIILAGGPSLDNYINWIEENQEHFVVIAVTRIARRLLKTSIKPDIFISVDPYPTNFYVSKEVFNYEKESLLVSQYHLSPMILGNWLGINFYLGELFPWKTELNKSNLPGIGPTVTNTAILLAINMGINKQILFGVDLCYSPDGYTHANSSNEHDTGPDINSIGQTVTTNNGKTAETNSAYFEAITTIEQLAKLAIESNGELINPSPNSAKMNNVTHTPINEIIINKEKIDISLLLEKEYEKQESSDFKVQHYKTILIELKKAQKKILKIQNLANKGLEYNEKFFSNGNPSENFTFKLKMDKLEKELNNKELSSFSNLSKKFGVNEFLYFLNPDSDRVWTNEDIQKSGDIYYKALKTGALELHRHIFTAINRTEVRLLENNSLTINDELIKNHLSSFDKSYLLDKKIDDQKNFITKDIDKQNIELKKNNNKRLQTLKENKLEIVKICKEIYESFHSNHKAIEDNRDKTIRFISFIIAMLQNEESHQTRRLFLLARKNPNLLLIPEETTYPSISPQDYIINQKIINDKIQAQSNNNSKLLIQQLENITENSTPAITLKNYFKGKSVLILEDSSLLNKHKTWIEQNQENFLVIATSQMAKQLLHTQIIPDIFIAIDPGHEISINSKDIFSYQENSLLVNQNYLSPRLLGNWLGSNVYFGNLFPWKSFLNIDNLSITNKTTIYTNNKLIDTAIYFSNQIGINSIYLISNNLEIHNTDNTLSIKYLTESNQKIIRKNLNDKLIKEQKTVNISYFLKENMEQEKQTDFKKNHYKLVIKELKNAQKKIDTIIRLTLKGIDTLEQLELNNREFDTIGNIISDINNQLNEESIFEFVNLSKIFGIYDYFSFDDFKDNNSSYWKQYYGAIKLGATNLSKNIFSAVNKVEIRLLEIGELNLDKDVLIRHLSSFDKTSILNELTISQKQHVKSLAESVLNEYNNKDKKLGRNEEERKNSVGLFIYIRGISIKFESYSRIFNLKKFNPILFNSPDNISIAGRTTKEWKDQLEKKYSIITTNHSDSLKLEGLENKLYNQFVLNDENAINKIIKGILFINGKEPEWQSFLHLAKGYKNELSGDINNAVEEYSYANNSKTLESALKRLTFISLNKGELEHAYNLLTMLTEISPDYLPQLAELHVLTKNYKDALDIYSVYLEYNSSDISILLKVANLYESQNIIDGAIFIYEQILKLDPDNQKAKSSLILLNNTDSCL